MSIWLRTRVCWRFVSSATTIPRCVVVSLFMTRKKGIFHAHSEKNFVFFIFFICAVMVEVTFGRCQNSKTVTCLRPGFSSLKRDVWVPQREMTRPKISGRSFLETLPKTWHWQFFWFQSVQFWARESARGPKKALFLRWDKLGSLGLRGISPKPRQQPQILTLQRYVFH